MLARRCLYHNIGPPTLQDSGLETVPSLNVRRNGYFCSISCLGWVENIRTGKHGEADGPVLVGVAGCPLYPWRWPILGQCALSFVGSAKRSQSFGRPES